MNTDGHGLLRVFAIAAAIMIAQSAHSGGPEYEVTAIIAGFECGDHLAAVSPYALNEAGDVVGFVTCSLVQRAFRWTAETGLELIPMPAGTTESQGLAINGSKVVGTYSNPELELGVTGFLYDFQTDQFTSLGTLPGGNWSQARAINSAGEIVGFWGDTVKGPSPLAFIWRDGEMIDIHPDFGTPRSDANDIDTNGLVTGWMGNSPGTDARAFIWDNGKVTELPPIPGGFTSKGNRINTRRQLAISGNFNEDHPQGFISGGFLWEAGQWTDLGMLPGYDSMALTGLNDDGTVTGWSRDIQNGQHPDTGFIWRNGVMKNLNDLIAPGRELEISRAEGINESGQITGQATSPDGLVAFVLTPIEPRLGDLDGDCQVGVADLLILLGNWGSCDKCAACPADLDNNCVVNVKDLLTLLGNWG
ncbi:MAG: hypothetical protein IIC46_10450 [Planctomycetes bacterium]|nr:hypothetical protein [Planctomycetota bacterium]